MGLKQIIIAGAVVVISCSHAAAQETCPLPVMVKVDNADSNLSQANIKFLDSKLRQLVATRGFGSNAELSHLCLMASVSETGDKQVISGNRPVVSGSFDVYMVLTNLLSGENFGAENITIKGVGNTESQMMQSAMSRINPSNSELQTFLQNARVKVFDYYRSHIPSIISLAKAMSQRGEYEKALYMLSTVPPCVDGYDSVATAMLDVYYDYLDVDCHQKLAAARAAWAASQNEEGATVAAGYIAAIDHRSSCYAEAQELLAEIAGRVDENLRRVIAREDEDRAFEKELVRGEAELRRKQVENDFELRQQEIEAIRQIGLAYAQTVIGEKARQSEAPKPDTPQPTAPQGDGKQKSPVIIVNN